ncbi:hypothetical protein ABVV53_04425 [Novosphingobium sp. RD2P27]|uniref:Right handed beta helix domain-containing protein n=1 Tax=Novosphingobium kalidii TaxID=3230299 RepID=A0ABV2CYM6_9SPHN
MKVAVKSKSMIMLLPLLAACSGGDGQSTTAIPPVAAASAAELDTAVSAQSVAQPTTANQSVTDFDVWAQRLMSDRISPIVAAAQDLSHSWVGADGKVANAVVRVPRTAGKPTISVSPPAAGGDATPVFQAALSQLKKAGGGILKVAPGEYHFQSANTAQPTSGHILVQNMSDVDIQAADTVFLFEQRVDGIGIRDSRRVRISGAQMRDAGVLSGTGRMRSINGAMTLVLDEPLPAGTTINWIRPMNEDSHTWPQTQTRAIIDPATAQPVRINDRTFSSPTFKPFKDGQYVGVKFTYYGTRMVYVRDSFTGTNEDIVLDGLRIGSTGGMGIVAKTRGRGLAIQNSSIAADPGRPYSTNYDGVHVVASAGDILIRNNAFAHTGDDQINLRSIIHRVTVLGTDRATLTNDARLIRVGDEVAFFNKEGEYLGRRFVASAPPIGHTDTITFGFKPGEPFTEAAFARVLTMTPRRFAIVSNRLEDSIGRGMLVQIPNGLIQNNTIRRLPRTAIRLLTSFDPWLEGAGAINVRITGNSIESGGAELGFSYATGIIMAQAEVASARIAGNMHNGPLLIDGNRFEAPRAPCVVVYSTKGFAEQGNVCGGS